MKGLFIAGTDTDVGKTFVSALMIHAIRSLGIDPYYYKPVASGGTVDIDTVRLYGGLDESNSSCPIVFETPCSPHLASEIENKLIDKTQMIKDCESKLSNNRFTLIEGAGGTVVPITRDGFDLHDLIAKLNLPVILVTKTGVGTINHTMLTFEFMKMKGIEVAGLVFNGYEDGPFEKDNIKIISERTQLPIIGVVPKVDVEPSENLMMNLAIETLSDNLKKIMLKE